MTLCLSVLICDVDVHIVNKFPKLVQNLSFHSLSTSLHQFCVEKNDQMALNYI